MSMRKFERRIAEMQKINAIEYKEHQIDMFKKEAIKRGLVIGAEISFKTDNNVIKKGIISGDVYWAWGYGCFAVPILGNKTAIPLYADGQWAKVISSANNNELDKLRSEIVTLQKQKGGFVKSNNEYRAKIASQKDLIEAVLLDKEELRSHLSNEIFELAEERKELFSKIDRLRSRCSSYDLRWINSNIYTESLENNLKLATEMLDRIKSKWWYKMFKNL